MYNAVVFFSLLIVKRWKINGSNSDSLMLILFIESYRARGHRLISRLLRLINIYRNWIEPLVIGVSDGFGQKGLVYYGEWTNLFVIELHADGGCDRAEGCAPYGRFPDQGLPGKFRIRRNWNSLYRAELFLLPGDIPFFKRMWFPRSFIALYTN